MLKKLLFLMTIILFSSSLIYGANCYSSATVNNNALIKIVSSDQALIAVPETLTKEENKITTTIKNNMSEKIWIKVDKGSIDSPKPVENEVPIASGESLTVTIIPGDEPQVTFLASWQGGSAQIISTITQ